MQKGGHKQNRGKRLQASGFGSDRHTNARAREKFLGIVYRQGSLAGASGQYCDQACGACAGRGVVFPSDGSPGILWQRLGNEVPGRVGPGRQAVRRFAKYLLVFFVLGIAAPRALLAIPTDDLLRSLKPTSDVSDFAGLLTPDEKAALEARCKELREKTGAQLAVVTLKSLSGGEIGDFANKLFARWGIGQKGKNNGLLLIVAMDERRSWVEVGYGLEPIVPDVLAVRILDHQLRPRFRQQQYAEGLTAAANALIELVEKGEPADREALAAEQGGGDRAFVLALAIFVGAGALVAGAGLGSKTFPAVAFGTFFGGVPGAIGIAIGGLLAALVYFPVALAGGTFGWFAARNANLPKGRSGRSGTPWTWDWGNVSSGGGTWSSGGGGGFSSDWGGFGGGSSGGGGGGSSW